MLGTNIGKVGFWHNDAASSKNTGYSRICPINLTVKIVKRVRKGSELGRYPSEFDPEKGLALVIMKISLLPEDIDSLDEFF